MNNQHYELAEETAKVILESLKNNKSIPSGILSGFHDALYSLADEDIFVIGPNVGELYSYLTSTHEYSSSSKEFEEFCLGVIYGSAIMYGDITTRIQNHFGSVISKCNIDEDLIKTKDETNGHFKKS